MIAEKQSEKLALLKKMDEKKVEFMSELAKFMHVWIEKQTLLTVKESSATLLTIGEDKAKELKTKIADLQENSSHFVEEYMNQSLLWWHLDGANSKRHYSTSARKMLPELFDEIGFLFGELGKLFAEYGVIDYRGSINGAWIKKRDYLNKAGEERLTYAYSISFSDELTDLSREYIMLVTKTQDINKEISKLEDEKKKENIEEWWLQL